MKIREKEINAYNFKEIFGDLLKITDEDLKKTFIKLEPIYFSEDIF